MINYTFCSLTDTGEVRDNNEDSVTFDAVIHLGILADGMGGHNAGEVASTLATSLIKSKFSQWLSETTEHAVAREVRRAIAQCVDAANREIFESSQTNSAYSGMGTTLVLAWFRDTRLLLGHIGDSRCYLLRGHQLRQLTKDHSLLQEYIDNGFLSIEQAAISPIKNLVTRALGVEAETQLELNEHSVSVGDIYLMCSDGLSDMVDDDAIAGILQKKVPLNQIAEELISSANKNGGQDNISVLLIAAEGTPDGQELTSKNAS